jgi:hypothetical protein
MGRFFCLNSQMVYNVKMNNRFAKTVVVIRAHDGHLLIVNCNSQPTRKDSYFI